MLNIFLSLLLIVVGTLVLSSLRRAPSQTPPKEGPRKTPEPPKKEESAPAKTPEQRAHSKSPEKPPKEEAKVEVKAEEVPETEPEVKEVNKPEPAKVKEVKIPESVKVKKAPQNFSKIVLYGSNNSCKTQLFYSLLMEKNPLDFQTVTSVSPNTSETFKFNGKVTPLVEVPGHSNFETKIGKFLDTNCLLLFVMRTGSKEHNYLGKTAYKLYEVLTKQDLVKQKITLGIVVVKDEGFEGREMESEFRKELEKEIERIKFSRRTHVNTEEGAGAGGDYLKDIKENFELGHIQAKESSFLFMKLGQDSLRDLINLI